MDEKIEELFKKSEMLSSQISKKPVMMNRLILPENKSLRETLYPSPSRSGSKLLTELSRQSQNEKISSRKEVTFQ
jgi:hypothetical protein